MGIFRKRPFIRPRRYGVFTKAATAGFVFARQAVSWVFFRQPSARGIRRKTAPLTKRNWTPPKKRRTPQVFFRAETFWQPRANRVLTAVATDRLHVSATATTARQARMSVAVRTSRTAMTHRQARTASR